MYTQFFGQFILRKKIISIEQLSQALSEAVNAKPKFGALAIAAGYMTAKQAEMVHAEQMKTDKRYGDICVEKGILSPKQVESLLRQQATSNALLGQVLIEKGYITIEEYEKLLADYNASSVHRSFDMGDEELISDIWQMYGLDDMENSEYFAEYISLLIRNIVRFVGDDFIIDHGGSNLTVSTKYASEQSVAGKIKFRTAIAADEKAFVSFASRYAGETLAAYDEFAGACVGEFLNLQNGLFSVNASNEDHFVYNLMPQFDVPSPHYEIDDNGVCVRIAFPFGIVNIIVQAV